MRVALSTLPLPHTSTANCHPPCCRRWGPLCPLAAAHDGLGFQFGEHTMIISLVAVNGWASLALGKRRLDARLSPSFKARGPCPLRPPAA